MKKLKITIHKDGTQKLEVLEGCGPDCVEFTKALENRLGKQEGERELKPEFSETVSEAEQERIKER